MGALMETGLRLGELLKKNPLRSPVRAIGPGLPLLVSPGSHSVRSLESASDKAVPVIWWGQMG